MAARQQQARQGAGVLDGVQDRIGRRSASLLQFGFPGDAALDDAWNRATGPVQHLPAVSSDDIVRLRTLARWRPKPTVVAPVQRRAASAAPGRAPAVGAPKSFGQEALDQGLAGVRGAQDAFTFGLGDRLYAGVRALGDAYDGADLRAAYARRMAAEEARDRYDAEHYHTARTVGQIAGTAAQVAVLGPTEGLVAGGSRIAQATPLIAREIGMLGGAGALTGVGGQAVSDVARGRLGSLGDYVGAGFGGATGALASRGGMASYAGAIDGGVTSVAQDLLNGRVPSIDRAREAALGGGVMGTVGGLIGRRGADLLTRKRKEQLGEGFSRLRTWARGDKTIAAPKSREYLKGGGYMYPDQRTLQRALVESKFGRYARLSKRQTQAYDEGLPNFRIDHALPRDVGAIVGLPLAEFGQYASPEATRRR